MKVLFLTYFIKLAFILILKNSISYGIQFIVNSWHKRIIMDKTLYLQYVSHMFWRQEFYKISLAAAFVLCEEMLDTIPWKKLIISYLSK